MVAAAADDGGGGGDDTEEASIQWLIKVGRLESVLVKKKLSFSKLFAAKISKKGQKIANHVSKGPLSFFFFFFPSTNVSFPFAHIA